MTYSHEDSPERGEGTFKAMNYDPRMNTAPAGFDPATDLPEGFWDFYQPLHEKFTRPQQEMLAKRHVRMAAAQRGRQPNYLPTDSVAATGDWKISIPDWVKDQRNQMTGPVDDAELSVKMLNSGAPGVMLDLEDSMSNQWDNLMIGHRNAVKAAYGELTYPKAGETVAIKDSPTVVFLRVRGLHLSQAGVIPGGEITSASLFDVALHAYQVDRARLKHNLSFYIPKTETAEEAGWWDGVLKAISAAKGWEPDYIKVMALVESFSLAYQFEEFAYTLRDHIVGLNLGRWDYMASLIHYHLEDPEWVLPNRNTIPHDVDFFQAVRLRIPEICHRRGILAIGGMTALYPSRVDAELNDRALKSLAVDKKNEANCGMDGAWTGHPDQNAIALAQFPTPNQLGKFDGNYDKYPKLDPPPLGVGERTIEGTRTAARTTILYRHGFITGRGASLINGYMEDLATDRIYRLMIAQRVKHNAKVKVLDENGLAVEHTPESIAKIYDEELEKILAALPEGTDEAAKAKYREARTISEEMITKGWFDPV
jgi:malate synthase